jgi:nucleoside 2-deoxyribosyltransferase
VHPHRHSAVVGASSIPSFKFLVEHLVSQRLAEGNWRDWSSAGVTYPKGMLIGRLTLNGWDRYEELSRKGGVGTRAFIAMKFGEAELNEVLDKHLRPAVKRTGFDLMRLDDEPRAGLIDNRLRMEIKQARFLLADLTHANNGAYWEAGYAEGLGKPVIYLCKKAAFEGKQTRPHFDTNHHQTIIWDQATIQTDMDGLVATIRFSIAEARQSD